MKKVILWTVVGGLGILAGALLDRSCYKPGPTPEYFAELESYKQQVADQAAGLEEVFRILAARDATIKLQDEFIAAGQRKLIELEDQAAAGDAKIAARDVQLEKLKTDAQAAIAASPAVRALVDAFELGRREDQEQIATLRAGWAEEKRVSEAKDVKIVELTAQRDIWKKEFEKSEKLRAVSDMLRKDLEQSYKASKFWTTIGKWGPPIAFAAGFILGK